MQKHPCLTRGYNGGPCEYYNKGWDKEPCKSCPYPREYCDSIDEELDKPVDMLRKSSPIRGAKIDIMSYIVKEKKPMEEPINEIKTETEKPTLEIVEPVPHPSVKPNSEMPKEKKVAKKRGRKPSDNKPIAIDEDLLKEFVSNSSFTLEELRFRGKRGLDIIAARKKIAQKLSEVGFERRSIGVALNLAQSTLWGYLMMPDDNKPPTTKKHQLLLDFDGYRQLYDDIIDMAGEELRSPENLVLWLLHKLQQRGLKIVNGELSQ